MEVVPAIDLLDGKVVRLKQGKRSSSVAYASDAGQVAMEYVKQGANRIHVVDLNAALGMGDNLDLVCRLATSCPIPLQVGGGIRSVETGVGLLQRGADRLVIGTAALDSNTLKRFVDYFGRNVWAAVDVKNGIVAANGWTRDSGLGFRSVLSKLGQAGVGGVVVTDVSGDGMLCGVSEAFFKKIRASTPLSLYAAGGIASLEDIRLLSELCYDGVIVGKALYEKRFTLKQAFTVGENVG